MNNTLLKGFLDGRNVGKYVRFAAVEFLAVECIAAALEISWFPVNFSLNADEINGKSVILSSAAKVVHAVLCSIVVSGVGCGHVKCLTGLCGEVVSCAVAEMRDIFS